jgi:hypothetical protein
LLLPQGQWLPTIQGKFSFLCLACWLRLQHRAVHHEGQPHKFAISWTISRSLADDEGGHFYNSAYGVRIQGGPDTVVAWDPVHWHGTSLQNYSPTTTVVSTLNQTGLSIFTPTRLQGLWDKYMEQQLSAEQVQKELAEGPDPED